MRRLGELSQGPKAMTCETDSISKTMRMKIEKLHILAMTMKRLLIESLHFSEIIAGVCADETGQGRKREN